MHSDDDNDCRVHNHNDSINNANDNNTDNNDNNDDDDAVSLFIS